MKYEMPLLLMALLAAGSRGFKILQLPMPARSHIQSQYIIGRELTRMGHEVHLLLQCSFPLPPDWLEEAKKGRLFLHTYGNVDTALHMDKELNQMTLDILTKNLGPEHLLFKMKYFNSRLERELVLESDQLMEHLESLKLDAVIVDYAFFIKQQVYVAHRLRLPVITYWDIMEPWLIRVPWMPSIFAPLGDITEHPSTFYSRTINLLKTLIVILMPPFEDSGAASLAKYRQIGEFVNSEEIISNSILFLVPQDPVLDFVRPLTSNFVLVGGLTTEDLWTSKLPPIPVDYLNFMHDNGKNSQGCDTVLVSFGSLVVTYPERVANVMLQAFERLTQYKFIWKFKNYLNLSIPTNVKIANWLPQKELLGHPSVKLFITHSGNNGQFEAIYLGVPMLAVHLIADQPRNARRIAKRNYGLELDFRTLEVEQLTSSIVKIITSPSYKENITKASKIFRSRPDTPAQRAAFWIEHVIRFGGDHLKPAGNDLTYWEYLCLDVLIFIEFLIVTIMVLFAIITWKLLKKVLYKSYLCKT